MSEQQQLEAHLLKDLCRVFALRIQRARAARYKHPVDHDRREHAELSPYRSHRAYSSKTNRTRRYSTGGLGSI